MEEADSRMIKADEIKWEEFIRLVKYNPDKNLI